MLQEMPSIIGPWRNLMWPAYNAGLDQIDLFQIQGLVIKGLVQYWTNSCSRDDKFFGSTNTSWASQNLIQSLGAVFKKVRDDQLDASYIFWRGRPLLFDKQRSLSSLSDSSNLAVWHHGECSTCSSLLACREDHVFILTDWSVWTHELDILVSWTEARVSIDRAFPCLPAKKSRTFKHKQPVKKSWRLWHLNTT